MAAVTALWPYGGPGHPYGSFAGKSEQVAASTPSAAGGKRRRYPRWVVVDGKRYRVSSPEEERQLLQAMLDRARTIAATGTHEKAQAAAKRAVRLVKRVEKTHDAEAQWLEYLQQQDEEILLLVN